MKKLSFICFAAFMAIVITGCTDERTPREGECMHCTGCFNSWTECESDWTSTEMTWAEHRDQKIAENPYSTDQCQMVE